jgi:DNA-binding transcriptional LysR family regulator
MDETLLLQFPKLLEIGRIRIGGLESLFDKVFPNAMRRFRALKPGVTCDFVSGNTEFLTQAVLQRQLDFAVCGEPLEPSAYHFEPLYTEHIAFIASDAHPLAGRSAISPEELLAYPTVVGGPTCLYYLRLSRQWMRYAAEPKSYHVSPISAIPGFIADKSLVGAVLESTLLPSALVKLDVNWDDRALPVGIVRRRETHYLPSSVTLMAKLIREETANPHATPDRATTHSTPHGTYRSN